LTGTPVLDRLAAILHAHQQRRANGRLPAFDKLDGGTRHALRNEVVALLTSIQPGDLAAVAKEMERL